MKCSVPMWVGGCPAGTCDNEAYGYRPPVKTHVRWDGYEYRDDRRYPEWWLDERAQLSEAIENAKKR